MVKSRSVVDLLNNCHGQWSALCSVLKRSVLMVYVVSYSGCKTDSIISKSLKNFLWIKHMVRAKVTFIIFGRDFALLDNISTACRSFAGFSYCFEVCYQNLNSVSPKKYIKSYCISPAGRALTKSNTISLLYVTLNWCHL